MIQHSFALITILISFQNEAMATFFNKIIEDAIIAILLNLSGAKSERDKECECREKTG